MTKKLIIDTDPGVDDIVALVLALGSPKLEVRLLTTVAGNVGVEKVTQNALDLLHFLKKEVPVARGNALPLYGAITDAAEIHGAGGISGWTFEPSPERVLAEHGVLALREELLNSPEPVTLVGIGPLTNFALLFRQYPEVLPQVAEVVFMGGGFGAGNTTTAAEFNVYADPVATSIVLSSGVPVTMIGLDVTSHALIHQASANVLKMSSPVGEMVATLLAHYPGGDLTTGIRMHDACTIAYLLAPELFERAEKHVAVGIEGIARGLTVAGHDAKFNVPGPLINVLTSVQAETFETWLVEQIRQAW